MSEDEVKRFLEEVFNHSMRHPADYTEWRSTLVVFARATGVNEETVIDAHVEAREAVDGEFAPELTDALDTALLNAVQTALVFL